MLQIHINLDSIDHNHTGHLRNSVLSSGMSLFTAVVLSAMQTLMQRLVISSRLDLRIIFDGPKTPILRIQSWDELKHVHNSRGNLAVLCLMDRRNHSRPFSL